MPKSKSKIKLVSDYLADVVMNKLHKKCWNKIRSSMIRKKQKGLPTQANCRVVGQGDPDQEEDRWGM